MKMFGREFTFAKPASKASPGSSDPQTAVALARQMFTEQAVTQLLTIISRTPEVDDILTSAGITRASLSKLETDDEIFAALRTRSESLLATPWRIETEDEEAKKFLTSEMTLHMENIILGAWTAVPYGYSVIEIVYKKNDDGRIGIKSAMLKPLEWFDPKRDGTLRYFPDSGTSSDGIEVDQKFKFFLTRHRATYKQPKGEALMSRLYWPWLFRYNTWQFWGQFIERFGQPMIVGKSADPKTMAPKLAAALQDAIIAVGKEDAVESLDPTTDGEAFQIVETVVVKRYQKLILGQTLTSDSAQGAAGKGAAGSLALGKVHAEVADSLRVADIRLVRPTAQRILTALCLANGFHLDTKLVIADEEGLEEDRAKRDNDLYTQGVRFKKEYYVASYKLNESDFDLTEPLELDENGQPIPPGSGSTPSRNPTKPTPSSTQKKQAPVAQKDEKKGAKASMEFAKRYARDPKRFTPAQQEIEDRADEGLAEAPQLFANDLHLLEAIRLSSSPTDLEHRLAELLKGTENEAFQTVLEQCLFLADIIGYANAEGRI